MRTIVTYITDDGKEFTEMFQAKKHECEMSNHRWEYYTKDMVKQIDLDNKTTQKFCKSCHTQILIS